jgi:hypothetical protein
MCAAAAIGGGNVAQALVEDRIDEIMRGSYCRSWRGHQSDCDRASGDDPSAVAFPINDLALL